MLHRLHFRFYYANSKAQRSMFQQTQKVKSNSVYHIISGKMCIELSREVSESQSKNFAAIPRIPNDS